MGENDNVPGLIEYIVPTPFFEVLFMVACPKSVRAILEPLTRMFATLRSRSRK